MGEDVLNVRVNGSAFENCKKLPSFVVDVLGDVVIESMAFSGCPSLSNVFFRANNVSVAYSGFSDSRVETVTILAKTISIGGRAFGENLTTVAFPEQADLIELESFAFAWCEDLESITMPKQVGCMKIDDWAFRLCRGLQNLSFPATVESVGKSAFESCSGLHSVSFEDGLSSIGEDAFSGCSELFSIKIPSTVTNIGTGAFDGCMRVSQIDISSVGNWLKLCQSGGSPIPPSSGVSFCLNGKAINELLIPDGVGEIGANAFYGGCFSSVTFMSGVTNVGENAFKGCESLSTVSVPSVEDWLNLRFANVDANPLHMGAALNVGGAELTELVIPEGTTEISDYAFVGGEFASVSIPNSVTNVASTAFEGCSNIFSVSLGGGLCEGMPVCKMPTGDWLDLGNGLYQSGEIVNTWSGNSSMSVQLNGSSGMNVGLRTP